MAALSFRASEYVLDTVGLMHYVEDRLSADADRAVRRAEAGDAKLLVPSIVVGEFIYSALKGRLHVADPRAAIAELLARFEATAYLVQQEMNVAAWQRFLELTVPELHDRMICAIALTRDAPVITNDVEIAAAGIRTIW